MTRRNPVARAVRRVRPTVIRSKKRDLPRKTKHKAAERRPCDSRGRSAAERRPCDSRRRSAAEKRLGPFYALPALPTANASSPSARVSKPRHRSPPSPVSRQRRKICRNTTASRKRARVKYAGSASTSAPVRAA